MRSYARALPGMPLTAADMHVCKIDDGAPRARGVASGAPPPPAYRWLVRSLCDACRGRGDYCNRHGPSYLEFMASGARR